jgi:hypothetical protein
MAHILWNTTVHYCAYMHPQLVPILSLMNQFTHSHLETNLNIILPSMSAPELKRLVAGFLPRRPGFELRSGQVRFEVDKVALGQVSPAILHSTKFSIITITRGTSKRLFSGRRAEWIQYGLHPPLCELKINPSIYV